MNYSTLSYFILGYFFMVLDFVIIIPAITLIFSISGSSPFGDALEENSTLFLALVYGLYFIGAGVFTPYFGALSDWLGRRKMILASLIGMAGGYFLSWLGLLFGSLPLFGFGRFFCGSFGTYRSLVFTSISDLNPNPVQRIRAFGLFSIIDAFLWFIFFLIGASIFTPQENLFLLESIGFPFWIAAFVLLLTALLIFLNFEDPFQSSKKSGWTLCLKEYSHFFKKGHSLKLYLLFTIFFLSIGSFVHIQHGYYIDFSKGPATLLLISYLLFALLWSLASAYLLPRLIQKIEPRLIVFFSFLTLALLWLILPFSPNFPTYFALILVFGLALGLLWPLSFFLISIRYSDQTQGKAQAITLSIYSFTALITAYLPLQKYFLWIQIAMIALLAIASLLTLSLPKKGGPAIF